jgi:multidrug efflux pump subunit AcrA (membrane-fusion protein)
MTTNSDTISAPKNRKLSMPRLLRKALWIALSVLLIAVTGGFAYYKLTYASAQATTEATLQTAIVRQGDLVLYASGTGTLVAADEVDLAFKTGGQVTDIPVAVGDQVETGDLLAQVDDTDAQIAYALAKRNLLELTSVAAVATAE